MFFFAFTVNYLTVNYANLWIRF